MVTCDLVVFQPDDSLRLPQLIGPHSSADDSLHMVLVLESSIQELITDTNFVFQRYVSGYYPYDGVSSPTFFCYSNLSLLN